MDHNKVFVPPIKIQGIKTKLVPQLCQLVHQYPYDVWIEPFMGSGVVGFNVRPHKAIFADINPHIINFYNAIKEKSITSDLVKTTLEKHNILLQKGDKTYYDKIRNRFNSRHNPLDFLFLNRSCFNGIIRFNKKGNFNTPYGHKSTRFAKAYITKIVNQVRYIENALSVYDWHFLCQPFEQTILSAPSGSLIYCDPPYIARHVEYYIGWSDKDELKLHNILSSSKHLFILSTWKGNRFRENEYVKNIWSAYQMFEIEHFYHVGAKKSNRNPITEAIFTNYCLNKGSAAGKKSSEQLLIDLH